MTQAYAIEVGFGGAWVMSPPNFYFIPDRNGDDKSDGEPIVLLDGLSNHANSHNLAKPEGLLQRLTQDEVRDLFAYLTGPDQVP